MTVPLLIKDKSYDIVEKKIINEYITTYVIKDDDNVLYSLFIEDYREADFMYEKFHKAVISTHGGGEMKTVKVEDITIE